MRRKGLLIAVAALCVVLGAAAWAGRNTYQAARIGTAYAAKQTCSCLFVSKRSPASCRTDYDPAAVEPLKWQIGADEVTVSALGGLVSAQAHFEQGFGCHPIN
jgi:hypothetical protein